MTTCYNSYSIARQLDRIEKTLLKIVGLRQGKLSPEQSTELDELEERLGRCIAYFEAREKGALN